MPATIAQWLDEIGLGRHAQAFADNDIDFANVALLSDADLRELGLSLGHRRTLQAAIAELPERPAEASPAADPASGPVAQRRQLTVLFCDLVGSTALSARLDPEDMRDLLRRYQDACASVIDRHEGYVAKFMGDGVYAYFGYPKAHEDDAERAVEAALGIVAAIGALRGELHDAADIAVRIGVATGNVAVGDLIGEAASEETNVVGEAPNLAARLQALAAPDSVVIADATHRLVGGMFEADDLGRRDLKGFAAPLRAWRVRRARMNASRFDAMRGGHITELVGRDEEFALLRRRWAQARGGEGQAVLISGEPGIGKSRLVRALRDSLSDEPVLFRQLQCSPRHTNSALFPFLESALSAIGLPADVGGDVRLDRLEDWIRAAGQDPAAMAPVYGPYLNIDTRARYPALDLPAQLHRERLYEAMCERLLLLAESDGLVLVVEDAHWIDPSSLELLGMYMDRALGRPNVMIVVTYRPEFEAPWVGRLHTSLIALSRLGRRECATLVLKVSGAAGLQPRLVEQISERTDGVPLFVEELTRVVLESAAGDLDAAAADVPATLHDSLVARLDSVGPARELAQLAACIGRSFPTRLLAAVRGVAEAEMDAALAPLVEVGLVYPERQRDGPGYAFKHAMVQQAAYGGLLRTGRRDYHGRIADALIAQNEQDRGVEPIAIAQHLHAANDIPRALHWYGVAAIRASDAGSLRESLDIVDRGLALLDRFEGDAAARDRAELDLLMAKLPVVTAIEGYASGEIDRIGARALELAEAVGDRDRESSVLYQIATMHEVRGEFAMTQATLARRKELIGADARPEPIVETGELMACSTFYEGRFDTSIEHASQALANSDPRKDSVLGATLAEEPTVACLFWMAKSNVMKGRIGEAASLQRDAFECASGSPHWYVRSQSAIEAALLATFRRDFAVAARQAEQAVAASREVGLAYREAVGRLIGEWAGALGEGKAPDSAVMARSLDVFREVGAMIGYAFYLTLAGEARAVAGDADAAAALVEEAMALNARERGFFYESEICRVMGMIRQRQQGDAAAGEAEALFRRARDVAREQGALLFELRAANALAILWRDSGRSGEARALLEEVCGRFADGPDCPDLVDARRLLDTLSATG